MPAGESSRSSDYRGGSGLPSSSTFSGGGDGRKGFNRWTLVVVSALVAFVLLVELRYQQGCDVSMSFSRHTSRIGGITLSALETVNVTHWLAFASLMEAFLLSNAKGDADTLLAAQAAAAAAKSIALRPQPLDVDFHVSSVQVAVDMSKMSEDTFWSIVTELEANHLHVLFDESRRVMHIYEKNDAYDPRALPSKYMPSWFESEPYNVGQPHATIWFVHLDTSTATYSIKQGAKSNRRRIFAEADIVPLKHLAFLGRSVPVPNNVQKVVAQEFAQELNDGIAVRLSTCPDGPYHHASPPQNQDAMCAETSR
ncbi:hypothetical protein DYB32_000015 [Aphanomyces invadans]|uniref:Uncharacterized protein n=1 Tax=Aphanomyces invadans TaxID=157072 RepID=A0A3R7AGQ9_9STRA|nr:hypothetical protein DYB32_000015 [Aphanomyces invadans]